MTFDTEPINSHTLNCRACGQCLSSMSQMMKHSKKEEEKEKKEEKEGGEEKNYLEKEKQKQQQMKLTPLLAPGAPKAVSGPQPSGTCVSWHQKVAWELNNFTWENFTCASNKANVSKVASKKYYSSSCYNDKNSRCEKKEKKKKDEKKEKHSWHVSRSLPLSLLIQTSFLCFFILFPSFAICQSSLSSSSSPSLSSSSSSLSSSSSSLSPFSSSVTNNNYYPTSSSFPPQSNSNLPPYLHTRLPSYAALTASSSAPPIMSNSFIASNSPPRFTTYTTLTNNESLSQGSEIVISVREGKSTVGKELIRISGEDPDGDQITFGVLGTLGTYILKIDNIAKANSAVVYLNQELDRETRDTYSLLLTLTDNKLGKGNFVTKTMVLIVEDVNDNDPIFKPASPVINLLENSRPGIIETYEATDIDQGRFGQVLYSVNELEVTLAEKLGINNNQKISNVTSRKNLSRPATFTMETLNGKGILRLIGNLDYEQITSYKLEIIAFDRAADEDQRSSSMIINVNIQDVNDNPPRFTKKLFTGGVTTEADFGTIFMKLKAIDLDSGLNGEMRYFISSPINKKQAHGLDNIKTTPFLLNKKSGELSLNFDPSKDMKGYFDFDVTVNDSDGYHDSAKVKIYLLREDQRIRFVLRLSPNELREKLDSFQDVLANITGAIVNVDSYKYHETFGGNVDKRSTDLYLHFVSPKDNSIMDVNSILNLIDKNQHYLIELYKQFSVILSEPAVYQAELKTWEDQLKAVLIGSTAFLALLLILVTCLCLSQRVSYERQLKAATTSTISSIRDPRLSRSNVPNTNIHADEGSNPIWMTGYDNDWYDKHQDVDDLDHDIINESDQSAGNSLDENAVGADHVLTESTTPTDSLNGSARESNSLTNERSALYRGVGGRITPQKISLPNKQVNHNHHNQRDNNQRDNNLHRSSQVSPRKSKTNTTLIGPNGKPIAPRPPISMPRPLNAPNLNHNLNLNSNLNHNQDNNASHEVTCKSSVNTVYISSYGETNNSNSGANNNFPANQLTSNLISLETTEL